MIAEVGGRRWWIVLCLGIATGSLLGVIDAINPPGAMGVVDGVVAGLAIALAYQIGRRE